MISERRTVSLAYGSIIILLISMIPFMLVEDVNGNLPPTFSNDQVPSFAGGNGTKENPYQISTVSELQSMRDNLYAHYILVNDIDASNTKNWNNGKGFEPIAKDTSSSYGHQGTDFRGSLDGDGHIITGLTIARPGDYMGLFGYINSIGKVFDLGLDKISITGNKHVGGITGHNLGTISRCFTRGNISGNFCVAGIAGENSAGSIRECYHSGFVSSPWYAGGIVGYNRHLSIVIRCYTSGNISGTYSSGLLIGYNENTANVFYSFFDKDVSGANLGIGDGKKQGAFGRTTSQMMTQSTFQEKNWDFDDIWWLNHGITYPYFHWEIRGPLPLMTIYDVQNISKNLDGNYTITNDIDGSPTWSWNSGAGFDPIGKEPNDFTGTLEGGGYNITDLFIDRTNLFSVGMFSRIGPSAVVTNVSLVDYQINGYGYVGSLASRNYGTISNSSASGTITGNNNVGGLLGYNFGNVSFSSTIINVNAHGTLGGLAGKNNGLIYRCTAYGVVDGDYEVGGLVGLNTDNHPARTGTIVDSNFMGNVNGTMNIGGITGTASGWVNNSFYNIDQVKINGGKLLTSYGIYQTQYDDWMRNSLFLDIDDYLQKVSGTYQYGIGSISDLRDMLPFATFNDHRFLQTSDIDLSDHPEFYIPDLVSKEYDGGAHKITGLNVTLTYNFGLGMFSKVWQGSRVTNLSVVVDQITGADYTACLAGINYGIIDNCSVKGDVFGERGVGGLVGVNLPVGEIRNCYSLANVSGDQEIGGLVGRNRGTVAYCYSTGSVSGNRDIGGLIGDEDSGLAIGGIWNKETSGVSISAGGEGKTTSEMKSTPTFTDAGWDFNRIWGILPTITYPFLQSFYKDPKILSDSPVMFTENDISYYHFVAWYYDDLPDGRNDIIWSLETEPDWLSISNGGKLRGFPRNKDVGITNATVIVTDLYGRNNSIDLEIEVLNINSDPTIMFDSLPRATEDELYLFNLTAFDMDPTMDELTWSIDTDADWLMMGVNLISGIPENEDVGEHWLNVTVTDDKGGQDNKNLTFFVNNVNDDPVIITSWLPDAVEDETYSFTLEAMDIDPTFDDLVWSYSTNALFMYLDPYTGILTCDPLQKDVGIWWLNFTLDDGMGGTANRNLSLNVLNVNDPPELNTTMLFFSGLEDNDVIISLREMFSDEDGDDLDYEPVSSDNFTHKIIDGFLVITPRANWSGTEKIVLTVHDGEIPLTVNLTVMIEPVNDAPIIVSVSYNSTCGENDEKIFSAVADDPDLEYGDTLTFVWISNITGVIGHGMNPDLPLVIGKHLLTLNITDSEGASVEKSFGVEVISGTVQPQDDDDDDDDDINGNEPETEGGPILWLFIILVIILVIAGLVIAGFFYLRDKRAPIAEEVEEEGSRDKVEEIQGEGYLPPMDQEIVSQEHIDDPLTE